MRSETIVWVVVCIHCCWEVVIPESQTDLHGHLSVEVLASSAALWHSGIPHTLI